MDGGRPDQALAILNQAKELGPENHQIYQVLGEIYREKRDPLKTLSAFKMVLFLRPWDETAKKTVEHLEAMLPQAEREAEEGQGGKKGEEKYKPAEGNKAAGAAEAPEIPIPGIQGIPEGPESQTRLPESPARIQKIAEKSPRPAAGETAAPAPGHKSRRRRVKMKKLQKALARLERAIPLPP